MVNFGVRRLNIGGKIMTNHLKQVVSYRAYNVMDETHLINDIKERLCYVSLDFGAELALTRFKGKKNTLRREFVLEAARVSEADARSAIDAKNAALTSETALEFLYFEFLREFLADICEDGLKQRGNQTSSALQFGVSRGRSEVRLSQYYLSEVVAAFGPLR